MVRATAFAPIGGERLVQRTVRRLGESIGMGLLAVGERLPSEADLAARLEISPMTLRQALAILRETGYIETTRGKGGGTTVKQSKPFPLPGADQSPTAEDLADLTEYRVAVSGQAAQLAARQATNDEVEQLSALVDSMQAFRSYSRFRQFDSRFHLGVAVASRSRRLLDAEAEIQRDLAALLRLAGDHPAKDSLLTSNNEHAMLVAAIRERDSVRAGEVMKNHVRGTADFLIGLRLGMVDGDASATEHGA